MIGHTSTRRPADRPPPPPRGTIGQVTHTPPPAANTRRIAHISIGILAGIAIAAIICCGSAITSLFTILDDDTPPLNIVITSCDHHDGETRIGFKVTNDGVDATSYRLRFQVLDHSGKTLSRGDEYVRTIDRGHSRDDAITLKYAGTGATCEYVGEAP